MYNIPAGDTKRVYSIEEFKGVDFTSSPIDVDVKRSPNAKNLINIRGFNETRPGYQSLYQFIQRINGVWQIDTDTEELFLVHSGTKLYQCSIDFKQIVEVISGMNDERSFGIYFNDKLVIFDGKRAIIFGKNGESYSAQFIDECGYIPTTSVQRDKSGGGKDYEKINLMSPYRINTFLSEKIKLENGTNEDGTTKYEEKDQVDFKLEESGIDEISLVEKLTALGEWQVVPDTDYIFNASTSTVTFKEAPGESPVLGRDNISIRYKKVVKEDSDKINRCKIITLFGYDGANNRIFATGNPMFKNWDFYCEQEDPTYWADENITKVGTEAIVGYSRLNDGTLITLKKHSDTDCTAFSRTSNLLNDVEVFPLKSGAKNIGCVSSYANANLKNDPLVLTEDGVYALISSDGEKYAMQRSYYVNGKLLKEEHLENATSISIGEKYYLSINGHMYIADSRYLSYPKNAKTEQYQYEWWYWDNIPARVLFSWNNQLFFGTEDGRICKFMENNYLDNANPIDAYWETPFLNLGYNQYAKTIRKVILISNPYPKAEITFGYKLPDETNEIIRKEYLELKDNFPKTIQEKEKIKKFQFIKFFFSNQTTNKMTFERLILEYVLAGQYRGE